MGTWRWQDNNNATQIIKMNNNVIGFMLIVYSYSLTPPEYTHYIKTHYRKYPTVGILSSIMLLI